jgi:hypothetical protein
MVRASDRYKEWNVTRNRHGQLSSYSPSYKKRINMSMIVGSSSGRSILLSAASCAVAVVSNVVCAQRNSGDTHLAHGESLGPLEEPRLGAHDRLVDIIGFIVTGDDEIRIIARR